MLLIIYMALNAVMALGFALVYWHHKKRFLHMHKVSGSLLVYQLKPQHQKINQVDFIPSTFDLSGIFVDPVVKYDYEYAGESYRAANLSLLGAAKMDTLNRYLGPKPKPIDVFVNPENPQQATLGLGQFKRRELVSAFVILTVMFGLAAKHFS